MGLLYNLNKSKKDSGTTFNWITSSSEELRKRRLNYLYGDQPELLEQKLKELRGEEEPKEEKPSPIKDAAWSFLKSTLKNPAIGVTGVSGLSSTATEAIGKAINWTTQKATDLARDIINPYEGTIDPTLYRGLLKRGKDDEVRELTNLGLKRPSDDTIDWTAEEKETIVPNLINGLLEKGVQGEEIYNSINEGRINKLINEKYPEYHKLANDAKDQVVDEITEKLNLPKTDKEAQEYWWGKMVDGKREGGVTIGELAGLLYTDDAKKSDNYGEGSWYQKLGDTALGIFTQGLLDFKNEPNVSDEKLLNVLENSEGTIGGLVLEDAYLKGATNMFPTGSAFLNDPKFKVLKNLLMEEGVLEIQ